MLLQSGHITDALRSSYARLLVDEYQDCNLTQHRMITWAARVLPTCVLGDPMQAIFNFPGNPLVHWTGDVIAQFPPSGNLQTPWRWRLAGTERLGVWTLAARAQLEANHPVDLRAAPPEVHWVQLQPATAVQQRISAARTLAPDRDGSVLVIGDARNVQSRHQLTSQTPGATLVETVEMADLISFARQFDPDGANALAVLVNFAASMMTGLGAAALLARVETIRNGRARTPPTPAELATVTYANAPCMVGAALLLEHYSALPGTHVYRPEMLRCSLSAIRTAASGTCTLYVAAVQVRERNRHFGRSPSRRAVGSTLLLKGLEADVAVILHPERMSAQHLYVALTRGARSVVICSETHLLNPALPN